MSATIQIARPKRNDFLAAISLATLVAIIAELVVTGRMGIAVSFCYGALFIAAVKVMAIGLGAFSVVFAVLARAWTFLRRGGLLCDCGPNLYQKLFRWLAILNILPALFILDTAWRTAELAPVRQRIELQMAQRDRLLDEVEKTLDEQRSQIQAANHATADQLGHNAQTALENANQLTEQIHGDLAVKKRVSNRILPDRESLQFVSQQLHAGFMVPGTNLWETLNSWAGFQLVLGFMMLTIGLTNGVLSFSRTQLRERGLWHASNLCSWNQIASYRWKNERMLELTLRRTLKSLTLAIPLDRRHAVAEFLAQRVVHAS